jgi:hypothetical protein
MLSLLHLRINELYELYEYYEFTMNHLLGTIENSLLKNGINSFRATSSPDEKSPLFFMIPILTRQPPRPGHAAASVGAFQGPAAVRGTKDRRISPLNSPKGIQLRRTRGYRKPPDAIVVSRPFHWGNPFRVGDPGVPNQATAVRLFEEWLLYSNDSRAQWMPNNLHLLRGRDLACWCRLDEPCHRNVLLCPANARNDLFAGDHTPNRGQQSL